MMKINKINRYILQKLFSPVLYLNEELSVISSDCGPMPLDTGDTNACRTLILSKSHYHEIIRTFPFSSVKEIRQAVAMDPSEYCPFEPECFFVRKLTNTDEAACVNLWFVRPSAREAMHDLAPWIVLPESAIAAFFLTPGLYHAQTDHAQGVKLLIHIRPDRGVTSISVGNDSAIEDAFRRGLKSGTDQETPDLIEGFPTSLPDYIFRAAPGQLAPFTRFALNKKIVDYKPLVAGADFMTAMILIFAAVSLALPQMAIRDLKARNLALEQSLAVILDQQIKLDQKANRYALLRGLLENYTPKLPMFNLLHQSLPEDVRISRLTLAGSQVEITGEAARSSDVLSTLSTVPGVQEPGFPTPVRKNPITERDMFTIRFIYEKPGP